MPVAVLLLALLSFTSLTQDAQAPGPAQDVALKEAVDRFFATQVAEDVEGYLALWSEKANRPTPVMLKFVFDSGDDRFSDVTIKKVTAEGESRRVRVSATRERSIKSSIEGRPPIMRRTEMFVSLHFVREADQWKLLSEGPVADEVAAALFAAETPEDRQRVLDADADLVDERVVLSISRRGGAAAQKQDFKEAQSAFELMLDVARRIGDRRYEGEALQNLANAFYYQRNFPAALQAYEARLPIEKERANDEGVAAALGGIATIRYSFAEYRQALTAYLDALAIQERLGDEAGLATTLTSTGNIFYIQGDYARAAADYTRSRELHKKLLNTPGEARALEGLGRVFLAIGDYARALEAFTAVLEEGRARNDRIAQGNASLSIGDVHFRLGNLDTARATFEESRTHFESRKDISNVGRVWQAIAITDLVAGRFAQSEEEYKKSVANCTSVGDQACAAAASAGLGMAQTVQEKYPDAVVSYRTATDQFIALEQKEHAARTRIGLSQALSGAGDQKAALAAAADSRRDAVGLGNDDVLWRALVAEARALRKMEDREQALAAARAAVGAIERLIDIADKRPGNPVARDTAGVFSTLAVLHAEAGDGAAAFETIERMHVHSLRLTLAPTEREIAKGMTDDERTEERTTAAELVALNAQLRRAKELSKPDPERIAKLEQSVAEAEAKRAGFQQRLFGRLPELQLWRGLIRPATRTDPDKILSAAGDVLVELVVEEQDLLLLTAKRGESAVEYTAHVVPMSRKAAGDLVAQLTTPDVLRDTAKWRKAAATFVAKLPSLLDLVSTATRVLIVPDDFLWRIPFEALPVGPGYLRDKAAVSYAHSVSAIVSLPTGERAAVPDAVDIVALGTPELHESVRSRVARTAPGWVLPAPDAAPPDLKAIVLGDGDPEDWLNIAGADASESAVRAALARGRVAHIALPFRINGASPLFSTLLTAGERSDQATSSNDAALEAREVMNMDIPATVVVFADGAAMSMRESADDAAIVQWAWRAAGVPAMVVPRWAVDQPPATELLTLFHTRLRAGDTPSAALHTAASTLRKREGTSAPYYWAGWLLIAAGR